MTSEVKNTDLSIMVKNFMEYNEFIIENKNNYFDLISMVYKNNCGEL